MADFYWVGDTGNWSDYATHWATTSGGSTFHANAPTSSDNVFFTNLSFTGTSKVVTVNATANMLNFDCSSATINFTLSNSAYAFNVYGNLVLDTNLLTSFTSTGYLYFKSTSSGKTITANSCTQGFNRIYFDGSGGEWTNQDAWDVGSSAVYLTNGTWNTNNQTITTTGQFEILTGTKTLTLGASTLYCGLGSLNDDSGYGTNLTVNSGTSHIIITTTGISALRGNITWYDITVNQTSNTANLLLIGTNSYHNLTINGYLATVYANQTISATLTLAGIDAGANRLLIASNTIGTARTITCNTTVTASNCDFRDITGAGTASWDLSAITGLSGDCGGNSGITFTTGVPQYWHEGTGSWSNAAKWFTATNGGGSAGRVPLPQDDVYFDADSFDGSGTITVDCPRIGRSLDMSAVDQAVTLTLSNAVEQYGSHILCDNITPSGNYGRGMMGRGSFILNLAGKTIYDLTINAYGGTYTNHANYVFRRFTQTNGTWVMGNYTHVSNETSAATAWTYTAGTVTPNESTIKLNPTSGSSNITFAGGGKTYNNIWFSGSHTGNFDITGSNTFNNIKIDAGRKVRVTKSTTQAAASVTAVGTSGNVITLNTVDDSGQWTLNYTGSDIIEGDYLNIKNTAITQTNTWYAGDNSTDTGNNTNILFYSSFKPIICFM